MTQPFSYILALIAGMSLSFAFAPYDVYYLAYLSPALLFYLWQSQTPKQAFMTGWLFGSGLLIIGIFWLHHSLKQFGGINESLAIILTIGFAMAMALYPALCGWVAQKYFANPSQTLALRLLMIYPSLWTLFEWLKGWILGGFPWLSLGYSQINTPFALFAPVFGVYGISCLTAMMASCLVLLYLGSMKHKRLVIINLGIIALMLYSLSLITWTTPKQKLTVSLIQGNIAQENKWTAKNLNHTLEHYDQLSKDHWQSDIIIWPETAIPMFYHRLQHNFLADLEQLAQASDTLVFIGMPVKDQHSQGYYNGIVMLGETNHQFYFKRHLVPFGEYIPLASLLNDFFKFLRIPMVNFQASDNLPIIQANSLNIGLSICYEDAFGEEIIDALPLADVLINVSNDAWFGGEIAPKQHLQIAQMRAIETGRYLLRVTNTGISAVITPQGKIQQQSQWNQMEVITTNIRTYQGATIYVEFGNYLVISLLIGSLLLRHIFQIGRTQHTTHTVD